MTTTGATPAAAAPTRWWNLRWWSLERFAAASGIVFIVMIVIRDIVRGGPPSKSASPEEFAQFFVDHANGIAASYVMFNLATPFFFLWLVALWRVLKEAEGNPAWLSALVLAGGIAGNATATISNSYWAAGGAMARDYEELWTPGLGTLFIHLGIPFDAAWLGTAVLQLGVALVIFRTGVFARWLAWWALVNIALLLIIQWPSPLDASRLQELIFEWPAIVTLISLFLWIFTTSVLLVRRAGPAPARREAV